MEEYRAGYRILVADDDINVHQSLNTYFRREGYQMISAYDGQEAIDHVRKSRPDIVLLDIMMPKMDGLMVCREIRKETNLPIIMLTAKGEEFDKLLGLELGADDYITKPFSPREVLARVKAVLRRMHELKDSEQGFAPGGGKSGHRHERLHRQARRQAHALHAQGDRNFLDAGQQPRHGLFP